MWKLQSGRYNYTCPVSPAVVYVTMDEYLPENGRKTPKHVGGLPRVCLLLYLIIVQLLVNIYIYIYIYMVKCSTFVNLAGCEDLWLCRRNCTRTSSVV